MRNLTIYGKVLILKSFALSQILYISTVLHIPANIIREIDSIMFRFLWHGKTHKVKKNVIVQDYCNGGVNMIDLVEKKFKRLNGLNGIMKRLMFIGNLLCKKLYQLKI